ncbi:MAG: 3-deoxy-7-phosphoheptulonate synthase, partial [Pseudomonadota bacterium]
MNSKDTQLASVPSDDSWTPESWQDFPASQQAEYPDEAALERSLKQLKELPPLVTS